MKNSEVDAMITMMDTISRAVFTRDVTEEFGLRRLHITNVRAEVSHGICHTNVDVDFDVVDRTTMPTVSVADGVTNWEMQVLTIHAKHTFWRSYTFWRKPTKLEEARMVRKVLFDGFIHELNECLTVDGERPFEPHKAKMPRRWWFAALKKRLLSRNDP